MEEKKYQIGVIIESAEDFHKFDEMYAKLDGRTEPICISGDKKPEDLEYPLRLITEEYEEKALLKMILDMQEEDLAPREEREKNFRELINIIGAGFDLVVWCADKNLD